MFLLKNRCKIILLFEYIPLCFSLRNLSLAIFNYTMIYLCVVFFIFIQLRVPGTCKINWFLYYIFFISFGKFSAIISLNVTQTHFLSPLLFNYVSVRSFDCISLTLSSVFFIFFSICASIWMLFVDLSLSSLILLPVLSNLLWTFKNDIYCISQF